MHNKIVYVLVGQRGAGKSTYTKALCEKQPEILSISRDDILIEKFGVIDGNRYTGNLGYGEDETFRLLCEELAQDSETTILLEYLTWISKERQGLIRTLRLYGATRVVALYFVTALPLVNVWFWQKPRIARVSEMRARRGQGFTFFLPDAPEHDHTNFHKHASTIDADGFDQVIRIDPLQPLISL